MEMTGRGTYMDAMASFRGASLAPFFGSPAKLSMDAQSTPNMATTSPADAASMSSMSSLCMRTRRGTFVLARVRALTMVAPLRSVPW